MDLVTARHVEDQLHTDREQRMHEDLARATLTVRPQTPARSPPLYLCGPAPVIHVCARGSHFLSPSLSLIGSTLGAQIEELQSRLLDRETEMASATVLFSSRFALLLMLAIVDAAGGARPREHRAGGAHAPQRSRDHCGSTARRDHRTQFAAQRLRPAGECPRYQCTSTRVFLRSEQIAYGKLIGARRGETRGGADDAIIDE